MTFQVTHHACCRFIERVEAVSFEEAEARIRSFGPAIERAIGFRSSTVKLGNGVRIIVDQGRVVTVLGRGQVNRGHWVPLDERQRFA